MLLMGAFANASGAKSPWSANASKWVTNPEAVSVPMVWAELLRQSIFCAAEWLQEWQLPLGAKAVVQQPRTMSFLRSRHILNQPVSQDRPTALHISLNATDNGQKPPDRGALGGLGQSGSCCHTWLPCLRAVRRRSA